MKDEVWKLANELKDELIALRRKIHMNPELGYQEFETAKFISEKLKEFDIEHKTNVAKVGVVGLIKGKSGRDKTIGIRADMDALALQEENDVEYKSKNNGVMHACGHDSHVAMLLVAAKILNKLKDKLNGNVKLFFQPAEETEGGAKPMVEEGVLENPTVSAVLGLHVEDEINVGTIQVKDGPLTASSDTFEIEIIGKGGHGAYPHDTIDPILVGAELVNAFQTISSRASKPWD